MMQKIAIWVLLSDRGKPYLQLYLICDMFNTFKMLCFVFAIMICCL